MAIVFFRENERQAPVVVVKKPENFKCPASVPPSFAGILKMVIRTLLESGNELIKSYEGFVAVVSPSNAVVGFTADEDTLINFWKAAPEGKPFLLQEVCELELAEFRLTLDLTPESLRYEILAAAKKAEEDMAKPDFFDLDLDEEEGDGDLDVEILGDTSMLRKEYAKGSFSDQLDQAFTGIGL